MLTRKAEPARLGRFQILKLLGKGAQGQVYLAEDTQLKRRVAIKTLELGQGTRDGVQRMRALLDEALIVGQLAHPHIVPLFDAGEQDGRPWLVFEYVEGKTLAAILRESGRLEPERALRTAAQVLEAVGSAHARGIIHCDIKPANVMLSESGDARVMDFGIARLVGGQVSGSTDFAGTPAYLAPETVAGEPHSAASDLFAVGMVLYEMLTGEPAISGRNAFEVMHRLVNEPFQAPSARVAGLDERLDDLVLKAIAKNPAERFGSAQSMAGAILAYLNPPPQAEAPGQGEGQAGALEFLLRRMRHKSDFPALSNTISAVNKAAASETEQVAHLSNSILKDFALTNKLLKLVNSAHFGQYRGGISTVSRAVIIVGFDNIRSVAVTLMLLEHLQNKAQAAQLKDEIIATLFSGLLARQLAAKVGVRSGEEAFICAMFHNLGRLLTAFYFHEEFQEIGKRCRQGGIHEERAALAVLGLSYEELGLGVARAWHFPERLTATLRRVTDDKVRKPTSDEQRLRVLSEMAGCVSDAARETDPAKRRARIAALAGRFGDGLGVSDQQLASAAEAAAQELVRETSLLDFKPAQSPLYCALSDWGRSGASVQPGARRAPDALEAALGTATLRDPVQSVAQAAPSATPEDARAVLTAGIQDITSTLVGSYELNDVLRIILETMYRAMGFTRVLLCVRDPASNSLRGRFGFGPDIDQVIKRGFSIPLVSQPDVFHAALHRGADIYIEDVDAEQIRAHIPDWYRKAIPARSLVLFPVLVNKKPVALFYADADHPAAINLAATELSLLKTLRNQAVLAIKQSS